MASSELPLEPGELGPSSLTPALDTGIGMGATSLETVTYDAVTGDYNSLPTYPVRPSYRAWQSKLRLPTQCVVFDGCPQDPHKPSSTPIYQTATFVQPSATEFGAYDYSRSGNPTRTALEKQVAMLEGAHAAFAFTSGMAALVAVTRLLKAGDELIVGDDIYGGMYRLVTKVSQALHGISVKFVDVTDLEAVKAALTPATRMVHMETPSNPMMRITDIRSLAALLRARGILLSIDSTMMSPILQRPLQLGADVVVHSATKFFGGHSDVMGGLVCLRDEGYSKKIAFFQNAEGTGLEPFACWLFLRGIKTLSLRVEKGQANAMKVAHWLAKCPYVTKLNFVGLPPDPADANAVRDYRIHTSQSSGPGCVMSFTTGSVALSRRFIDALRIFKLTVSFGSVNSLCEMPCYLSHASIPGDKRTLPEDLIRLSVGIEDANDLIHDIQQAFELAGNAHVANVRAVRRRSVAEGDGSAPPAAQLPAPSPTIKGKDGLLEPEVSLGCDATTSEDAALIARSEIARLQATVRVLKERIAEGEARSAGLEAARRLAIAGGNGSLTPGGDGATGGTAGGSGLPAGSPLSIIASPYLGAHGLTLPGSASESAGSAGSPSSSSFSLGASAVGAGAGKKQAASAGGALGGLGVSSLALGVAVGALTSAVAVALILGRRA